ncbi:MAG: glycosyl hydrolase family 28 protein [Lentimicrobiaceae bacterium]|nr:glycosyl hydrolase family 28 protein [Lentimicrobiaceae bacterium]
MMKNVTIPGCTSPRLLSVIKLSRKITGVFLLCLAAHSALAKDYLITNFGAKPGVTFINTEAINKAIDKCFRDGGGRVIIPTGTFKSGTIIMKDNVELHLEIAATLLASAESKDFPRQPQPVFRSQKDPGGWHALIYAEGAKNIAITGSGTIDGNGAQQKPDPNLLGGDRDGRPRNILFISCKYIRVQGIKLLNSGLWNQHYLNCEDVIVDRIEVYNHSNRNNDAIDIDGCRRFILSNSILDTDDDGITLKSTGAALTGDVVITNCVVSSFCNAIKAGTESTGGFKNISISNCVIKPSRNMRTPIYGLKGGITGISLEIVDGGLMEGITISNVSIEGTACPIYIRLGNRARKHIAEAPEPPMGQMRNIAISNVTACNTGNYSSSITAVPGYYVENVSLSNIQLYNDGEAEKEGFIAKAEDVKEDEKGYPQPTVWKNLPSSGFFIRHAKNVQINGLMLGFKKTDPRVPVIAVDVDGLQIKNIAKINNSGADVFFFGKEVKNLDIDAPVGWEKRITNTGGK